MNPPGGIVLVEGDEAKHISHTLSTVEAGRDEVPSTLDKALTDVSPVLEGSTAAKALV